MSDQIPFDGPAFPIAVRTEDSRFENLPGFDFAPRYVEVRNAFARPGDPPTLRMHYIDEGPKDAPVVLMAHGEPTWCYLYRKLVPIFVAAGYRAVAVDHIGFGRSDKLTQASHYTFETHIDRFEQLVTNLGLSKITLVCQDWGGILGLTIVPDMPDRFSRLIVMNTTIPTGEDLGKGFFDWRAFNRSKPDLDISRLMKRSCPGLTESEALAYDAPFPDASFKAGVRRFPELVMTDPDMPGVEEGRRARTWWKHDWRGESFMAVGAKDPVLGVPVMSELRETIRNCPEALIIEEGGHFVQEDGEQIARAALDAFG